MIADAYPYLTAMNRRTFLQTTSAMSAATLLSVPGCADPVPKFEMGLQLFGVREDMTKDPVGTLKAVKAMGYQHVEVYGFEAGSNEIYGMPCADFKAVLADLELSATSGHFGFHPFLDQPLEAMLRYTDQCIIGALDMGLPYITWPWMAPEQRTLATFEVLPNILTAIAERVTEAGLEFTYHNHDFEFVDYGGKTGYDMILEQTDPELVKLQIDMYWVMHAARKTPKQLIAEQPGRYVMWHIKDMHKVSRDYTELGNGSLDYAALMPDPEVSGLRYYYLEQGGNFTHNPLRSAKDSADFFQKNLRQLI